MQQNFFLYRQVFYLPHRRRCFNCYIPFFVFATFTTVSATQIESNLSFGETIPIINRARFLQMALDVFALAAWSSRFNNVAGCSFAGAPHVICRHVPLLHSKAPGFKQFAGEQVHKTRNKTH